jgi:hypothetical protein
MVIELAKKTYNDCNAVSPWNSKFKFMHERLIGWAFKWLWYRDRDCFVIPKSDGLPIWSEIYSGSSES